MTRTNLGALSLSIELDMLVRTDAAFPSEPKKTGITQLEGTTIKTKQKTKKNKH